MTFKFASICTSGGVFEQGVIKNNIKPIWGVEINPRVADVYRINYPDSQIIVEDACVVDWSSITRPDFLHASPSCRNFSGLNTKTESTTDIDVAKAISKAIVAFKPDVFTLENVRQYKNSIAWNVIKKQLDLIGYKISANVSKLKEWGIPQKKRDRFIVVAVLNKSKIVLSPPHLTNYWYKSIEDLIPNLVRSQLTNTQIKKLHPNTIKAISAGETVLLKRNQIRKYTPCAYAQNPFCWSPTATLATDQNERNRSKFADLVTINGTLKLTVRCLARIQTIDDLYNLPDSVAIAGLVVGDAIPPLFSDQMWQQILKQL